LSAGRFRSIRELTPSWLRSGEVITEQASMPLSGSSRGLGGNEAAAGAGAAADVVVGSAQPAMASTPSNATPTSAAPTGADRRRIIHGADMTMTVILEPGLRGGFAPTGRLSGPPADQPGQD
jgi:hypothetical protein